jgi:hypothetical protein
MKKPQGVGQGSVFQLSSYENSRLEAKLSTHGIDFHMTSICHLVDQPQKACFVVFQTRILKVIGSNVSNAEQAV